MLTFNFLPASSVFDLSFQFVMLLLLVSVCTQFHHLFFNRKFGASLSENGLNIQRACQKHEWKKEIVPVTQIMLAQAVTWPGHTLDRTGFDYQHSTHIFPFPKSSSRAFGSTQPPPYKMVTGFLYPQYGHRGVQSTAELHPVPATSRHYVSSVGDLSTTGISLILFSMNLSLPARLHRLTSSLSHIKWLRY